MQYLYGERSGDGAQHSWQHVVSDAPASSSANTENHLSIGYPASLQFPEQVQIIQSFPGLDRQSLSSSLSIGNVDIDQRPLAALVKRLSLRSCMNVTHGTSLSRSFGLRSAARGESQWLAIFIPHVREQETRPDTLTLVHAGTALWRMHDVGTFLSKMTFTLPARVRGSSCTHLFLSWINRLHCISCSVSFYFKIGPRCS